MLWYDLATKGMFKVKKGNLYYWDYEYGWMLSEVNMEYFNSLKGKGVVPLLGGKKKVESCRKTCCRLCKHSKGMRFDQKCVDNFDAMKCYETYRSRGCDNTRNGKFYSQCPLFKRKKVNTAKYWMCICDICMSSTNYIIYKIENRKYWYISEIWNKKWNKENFPSDVRHGIKEGIIVPFI